MGFETIKTEEIDGVYIITLARPESKNAVNNQMWLELCQAFDFLENKEELRCCVITNEGDCFSAGADLKKLPLVLGMNRMNIRVVGLQVAQKGISLSLLLLLLMVRLLVEGLR